MFILVYFFEHYKKRAAEENVSKCTCASLRKLLGRDRLYHLLTRRDCPDRDFKALHARYKPEALCISPRLHPQCSPVMKYGSPLPPHTRTQPPPYGTAS